MGRENLSWIRVAWGKTWATWATPAIPESGLTSLESGGREGIRTPGLLVANEEIYLLRRGAATTYAFQGHSKMGNLGNSFGGLFKCRQRVRVTNASWWGEGKGSHGTQLSLDLEERPQIVVERAFSTLSTLSFTL